MITREQAIARWNWQVIKITGTGPIDVLVSFIRITGETHNHTFAFASEQQLEEQGEERFRNKAWNHELSWSEINRFDLGEDSYDIKMAVMGEIRKSENVSLSTMENKMDSQYPDSLFRPERFVMRMREQLSNWQNLGYVMTFDQLKVHINNNVFEGLDG